METEKLRLIALQAKELARMAKELLEERERWDWLTMGEAAEQLKVSKTQIMRLEQAGKLRLHRLSPRKFYVLKADIEALLNSQ